jgi:DNA-binding response OmpR family regulator
MSLVLIVEDDSAIHRVVSDNLRFEHHEVISAADGEAGYRLALEKKPDLVILDIMLPKMTGLEVCRRLREDHFTAPIIMMTARGEEGDRVLGLDLGADDYVTKPCSIRELLARVRAHLRRAAAGDLLPGELRFDDISVDFLRYEALKDGRPLELTRKEFGLLRLLTARAGQVVNRDAILSEVWGFENYPSTRTVDNHVSMLRAKIERDPARPQRLLTVHGVGYKLVV